MAKRSEVSIAQRREAVLSLLRREEPATKIARRFGVSEPTLYRWRDEFLAGGEATLSGSKENGQQQRIHELENQIEKRDQVIGELTIANRSLKKALGPVTLAQEHQSRLREMLTQGSRQRLTSVLRALDTATGNWYRQPVAPERRWRPGPAPKRISEEVLHAVVEMATENPWYGYKKIAVMCRREKGDVKDREAYIVMRDHGLLQKRRPRGPELHQASKLSDLLPEKPNDLWQMDVSVPQQAA